MGLLNLINPVEGVQSIKRLAQDIINYRFYRKQIRSIEAAGFFKPKKMRVDYLCRVYYVVNLEPELQLATGDLIDLEKSRVFESVAKLQGIFADRNLVEIVDVSSKRIKNEDYYAYLVTVKYKVDSEWIDCLKAVVLGALGYYAIHLGIELGENWNAWKTLISQKLNSK